jgi:hypothetical protein
MMTDTMMPLLSAPWQDTDGNPLAVTPLPGLRADVISGLDGSYPGLLTPSMRSLLGTCCGLAATELGCVDFTGCWFPEEPCPVFRPCLTLAIDDQGRRWLADVGGREFPGPVWCVFSDPGVAVYVSDDLPAFVSTLRDRASRRQTRPWLHNLTAQARTVWYYRRSLAVRPTRAVHRDPAIRGWLATLPPDAYVYDLREQTPARGWPYGLAGAAGRLFRCGRLPIFAVAGSPMEGWRAMYPVAVPTPFPAPDLTEDLLACA